MIVKVLNYAIGLSIINSYVYFVIKKESKFGILFRHWVFANAPGLRTSTFELKQTATDSIPFSCVEDHQQDFSMAIRWGKKGALIRNESGTPGAPDYSFFKNAPAYIVIKYPDGFVLIDIDTFILEKGRSIRKSLTWQRAQEISWKTILAKDFKLKK